MHVKQQGEGEPSEEPLSEDERRALRGSRFAPLPPPSSTLQSTLKTRVAHPGGSVTTNKAAALAKFLQRKLDSGSASLDPALVEAAVENAKAALNQNSSSAEKVRHVDTFSESAKENECEETCGRKTRTLKKRKKKRLKKEVKSSESLHLSAKGAGFKGPSKKRKN